MKSLIAVRVSLASALALCAVAWGAGAAGAQRWRPATVPELRKVIPARAPVIKENIETEFRTASGVTDGAGRFIAGVVMITAGYSAEGKYSHFFLTQAPLRVGELDLPAGQVAVVVLAELVRQDQQRVQRRAQLVRHVGQELGLVLGGQRELLGLFFQGLARLFHFRVLALHLLVLVGQQAGLFLQLLVGLLQLLLLRLQELFRRLERLRLRGSR